MSKKQKLIYGQKAIIAFLEKGESFEQIFISDCIKDAQHLIKAARKFSTPYTYVNYEKLRQQFGALAEYQAVAVVSKLKFKTSKELLSLLLDSQYTGKLPLAVALDKVADPGNIGTIIRTLDASGAVGLITDNTSIIKNNRLMRNASAGAIFTLSIARDFDLKQVLFTAQKLGVNVAATSSHKQSKSENLYDLTFKSPTVLVVGAEETGISKDIEDLADQLIYIPQVGTVESLNVGVATSIFVYEFYRQFYKRTNK